jgi:ubiquinone/menaquinone biosynthesis C-methylase UbiE
MRVPDAERALSEMARVPKAGGRNVSGGGDAERERIDKKIGKIRKFEGVGERDVEGLGGGKSR